MSEAINHDRRRFLATAAITNASVQLGKIGSAKAQSGEMKPAGATTIKQGSNTSFGPIVVHNYRWRLGLAEGEAKYDELEKRLAAAPVITVPTITLEGDANGAPHPDASSYAGNSLANMRTGLSRAASGTICPRKPRRILPGLLLMCEPAHL